MTAQPQTQPQTPDTPPAPQAHCRNCGALLQGPHCHACGQPVQGLMRPLRNVLGDMLDSVFDFDTRIPRTLLPLFTRPGFLSTEYFAGRQIRYVTPFRLLFFLCVMAFFVARLAIDAKGSLVLDLDGSGNAAIAAATSVAEVEGERDARLAELAAARQAMTGAAAAGIPQVEAGADIVRNTAAARIRQLQQAQARGEPPPPPMHDAITFNGDTPWDASTNPVHLAGAPAFVDTWLNDKVGRAQDNIERIKADPGQYLDAFVGAIPTALFVLVPVFALLLKLAYLFKRRLYMEHLVVALHSHAFISLDLLLVFTCMALRRLLPDAGIASTALGWCIGGLLAWLPLYLLLMQKRVYAQGWPITLLKYSVLGTVYLTLLGFAVSGAAIASLVWM